MDTEERGYIYMQITMEAVLQCYWQVWEVLLPSQSCANLQLGLTNYSQSNSPMPVLPTMQSDDVRQENMATVNTA